MDGFLCCGGSLSSPPERLPTNADFRGVAAARVRLPGGSLRPVRMGEPSRLRDSDRAGLQDYELGEESPGFEKALTFFDVTNITVGAIVGADIYIAAAITAGILGPASLVAWVVAGGLATLLALTLAECARLVPAVGGPYAYAHRAFGPLAGFLAGWSMWIAELTAIPVFAIAFTNYLGVLVHLDPAVALVLRVTFVVGLTGVNVLSVRAAGRVNDALTALKLLPLFAIVLVGGYHLATHPGVVAANLTPFAPNGFSGFSTALVLIFWAYAGFELTTVPTGEVRDPQRTIPRALAAGMAVVTLFYLTTNFVIYALIPSAELALSKAPLTLAATTLFGAGGVLLVTLGAIVSVTGSDESDILGSSRLAYAMAADGLLPHALARLHPTRHTPHVALMTQAGIAIPLVFIDQIGSLISFAVFNLTFAFLVSALALIRLHRQSDVSVGLLHRVLPFVALLICLGLLIATPAQARASGVAVLLAGAVFYSVMAPGHLLPQAMSWITDTERALHRLARRRMRFLGGLVGWLGARRSP